MVAGTVATAFVLLVCGSNAMAPLLPLYTEHLALTALDSAAVFSGYFLGLVGILILAARTRLVAAARVVLPLALVVGLAGDVALMYGSSAPLWLLIGRVLVGASVALGTGAAAAVMVAIRGEQGRAFLATGSLIGACAGLLAAMVIVELLPGPLITVYAINAGVMVVALVVLLAVFRSAQLPQVLSRPAPVVPLCDTPVAQDADRRIGQLVEPARVATPQLARRRRLERVSPRRGHSPASSTGAPRLRRQRLAALLTGGAGWAIGALAVGALPAALVATGTVQTVSVGVAVGGVCLLTSCLTSLAGIGSPAARWWPLLLAGAWALVTAGLWASSLVPAILGCAAGGVAQAASYRSGLRRLTVGLDPVRQGQVASAYSAFAYSSCAVLLLLCGALQLQLGESLGLLVLAALYAAVCCVTIALAGRAGNGAGAADTAVATSETAGQGKYTSAGNRLN